MDTNIIVATSATVIALAALVVTLWQGIVIRKHNRLSVTPHIRIDRTYNPNNSETNYTLKNCGVGPGILTTLQLAIDGKIFPEQGDLMYKGVLKILDIDYDESLLWLPIQGDAISAGEELKVLGLFCGGKLKTKKDSILKALPRLGFVLKYKSIYGDNYTTNYMGNNLFSHLISSSN